MFTFVCVCVCVCVWFEEKSFVARMCVVCVCVVCPLCAFVRLSHNRQKNIVAAHHQNRRLWDVERLCVVCLLCEHPQT